MVVFRKSKVGAMAAEPERSGVRRVFVRHDALQVDVYCSCEVGARAPSAPAPSPSPSPSHALRRPLGPAG